MLRSLPELRAYTLGATDGDLGQLCDLLFDDRDWIVRHLVVETGSWLLARKVLLSPYELGEADWAHRRLPVQVSREQVRNSPRFDTEQPVLPERETLHAAPHDGHPQGGQGHWPDGNAAGRHHNHSHLRSCNALIGYHIHSTDGHIGHLQGMLVDEEAWSIRYLVVNTSNWWRGHQVLVPPDWIMAVSWDSSQVIVDVVRQAIQDSPAYHVDVQPDRQQEVDFFQHHDRPPYWDTQHPDAVPHGRRRAPSTSSLLPSSPQRPA